MFCPKCGTQNDDGARFCASCGTSLSSGGSGSSGSNPPDIHNIPSYMAWAVLATLLCCLPLGIVSIVKASNVNKFKSLGDFNAAMRASNDARNWVIWSAVLGFIGSVIYVIIMVANDGNM